jgi:hypothetical protein
MEATRFFLSKFFYCNTWKQLEFARVTYDCVILCFVIHAFIFELFMCEVLRLGFFYYKVMIYFFIFFGLGLELETDHAF